MYLNNPFLTNFLTTNQSFPFDFLLVSAEKEKELLTKKLKSSREAVKQLSQENNELRGRTEA